MTTFEPRTVLQVHKFFYPHAGSETALFNTRELLENRGHRVIDFAMEDDRNAPSSTSQYFARHRDYRDESAPLVRRAADAVATVYSLSARKRIQRLLDAERPDVAHLHLISHQLTFSVVDELSDRNIPIVMTLHDYKIGCPAYVLYRDGHRCMECTGGAYVNAIRHRCLKGSLAGSAIAATEASLARLRGSWHKIDHFIAPSAFAAMVANSAGIPEGRITVLPNFMPADELVAEPAGESPGPPQFFFAGRLEEVKGIRELLHVFEHGTHEMGRLLIAGAGGDLEAATIEAASRSDRIEYLGRVERPEIRTHLARSRAAVIPSLWDENNPFSLLEARAAGTAVIATDVGGLPEMVTSEVDGLLVRAGDTEDLAQAISRLAASPALAQQMAVAGLERLRAQNDAEAHYQSLLAVYAGARETRL